MGANEETGAAWAYHDATKHTWASVRTGAHMMDFTNQPRPWKLYETELPAVALGNDAGESGAVALDAIGGSADGTAELTLPRIAALLLLSAGVTKQRAFPGQERKRMVPVFQPPWQKEAPHLGTLSNPTATPYKASSVLPLSRLGCRHPPSGFA